MIEYEKKYEPPKDLSEFLGVAGRVQTPYVKKWVSDALEERDSFWRERGVVTEGKD